MATTRRSPNATLVTQSAIDEASSALQELPDKPKEKLSLREAVETLRDPIVAALEKGYSYEDITVMLANQGVNIAPSSLKHYLARSNRQLKAKGSEKQIRRKRAAKAAPDDAEADQFEAQAAQPETVEAAPKRGRQKAANASKAEPAAEAAPEETPKRGRRASGKSEAKPKTTTRSVSRTKATASSSTRKRRS